MVVPLDLTGESINELAEFDVPELVREVQTQFAPIPEKETSVLRRRWRRNWWNVLYRFAGKNCKICAPVCRA